MSHWLGAGIGRRMGADMVEIGERIRRRRQRAGLSQHQLAGEEFSASYVSLIESGKRHPSDEVLTAFARRLACTIEDLRVEPTDDAVAELEITYARLALANGEPGAARHRVGELLDRDLSRHLCDDATLLLAQCEEAEGDLGAAIATLRPLADRALAGRSSLPVSSLVMNLIQLLIGVGDTGAAVRVGEDGLRAGVAAGLSDTEDHFMLEATVVLAYLAAGDRALAGQSVRALVDRAEAAGSRVGMAAGFWNAALVADAGGRVHEALHLARRALGVMSEVGSARNAVELQCTVAWYLLMAEPDQAAAAAGMLDRASGQLFDQENTGGRGTWESSRSLAHLLLGEWSRAEHLARRAALHLMDAGDAAEAAQALMTLGDAQLAVGHRDRALDSYDQASTRLTGVDARWKAASLYRSLAYRMRLAGDDRRAVALLDEALDAAGVQAQTAAAEVAFGHRPVGPPARSGPPPSETDPALTGAMTSGAEAVGAPRNQPARG